ncbi:hypothetical protein CEXT_587911 [Caerostris extrusa]|uniref:Transposase n=1 Tax=Caerostris extrusa TaxID=172846 RepID=A0AAV4NP77_CAEEX|nr:hypothetical protein CEXT_587911 [Caerostris extrusa]
MEAERIFHIDESNVKALERRQSCRHGRPLCLVLEEKLCCWMLSQREKVLPFKWFYEAEWSCEKLYISGQKDADKLGRIQELL